MFIINWETEIQLFFYYVQKENPDGDRHMIKSHTALQVRWSLDGASHVNDKLLQVMCTVGSFQATKNIEFISS